MRALLPVPACLAAVLAAQAFPSWGTGIREQFASDVTSYEAIARAAPGLPSSQLPSQHAQRFPVHWLAGAASELTGVGLHAVYRVLSVACIVGLLVALDATFRRLGLTLRGRLLCLGVVAASPYPVRYLFAAPGMLSDAVFLLGLSLVLLAFASDRPWLVAAGVVLATAGRQTAVPVALFATSALLVGRQRARIRWAVVTAAASALAFGAELVVSRRFSSTSDLGSFSHFTVVGSLGDPHVLADHVGRLLLPLIVPVALLAAAWLRTRERPPWLPMLLAAAVMGQPLLLGPAWLGHNEPRLVALGLPALAVATAAVLRHAALGTRETAVVAAALLAASLHPRYTDIGVPGTGVWAALAVAAAVAIVATLALSSRGGYRVPSSSRSTAR